MLPRRQNSQKEFSTILDSRSSSSGTTTLTSSETRSEDTVRPNDAESQHNMALRPHPGHTYGSVLVDRQSQAHMGDIMHNYNEGAQVGGHYIVEGDIFVHNNHYSNISNVRGSYDDMSQHLRKTLYYASMDNRRAMLNNHNIASFEWIWDQTTFPSWLKSDQGIYWIQGKPASGKSTLLNYLTAPSLGSRRVEEHLRSHHAAPLLLHFFFDFRAGRGIANTPVGMLRSMLLQLVQKSTAVERHILSKYEYRSEGQWPELESELCDMLCECIQSKDIFVWGFLDGLDEFEGNLLRLLDSIIRLQARTGMKLCIASRPEALITHKLEHYKSLRMQDFNKSTIIEYAEQQFADLSRYLDQEDLVGIANRIATEANGVILWARFAVDEIVCAILGGNGLQDIKLLLDSFPPELEGIYNRIWNRLTEVEQQQAVTLLFTLTTYFPVLTQDGLDGERLLILTNRILSTMGSKQLVSSSRELKFSQFRLKVQSLLHGLVEFQEVPEDFYMENLGLFMVHKTLKTFVGMNQQYQAVAGRFHKIMDYETWEIDFEAQNIICASEFAQLSTSYQQYTLDSFNTQNYARRVTDTDPAWNTDGKSIAPSPRLAQCSMNSMCNLLRSYLYPPQLAELTLRASQTKLLRSFWSKQIGTYEYFRTKSKHLESLAMRAHPELLLFMHHGHLKYYMDVWNQASDIVTEDDKNFLFNRLLFGPALSFRVSEDITKLGPRGIWVIMRNLAETLSTAAKVLAVCVAQGVEVFLINLVPETALKYSNSYDWTVHSSDWWPYEPCHFLLIWVGSLDCTTSKSVQRARLAILLTLDIPLNEDIYKGGNVMDALFDPGVLSIANSDILAFCTVRERSHFSKEKFEVLIEAGFDIGNHTQRYVEAAEILSDHLKMDSDEFKVRALDDFVIPSLKEQAGSSKT